MFDQLDEDAQDLPHFNHQPSQFTTMRPPQDLADNIVDDYFDEDKLEGKKGPGKRVMDSEEDSDQVRGNFASKQTERDLLDRREEKKRGQDDFSYDDEDEQEMFSFR